MNGRDKLQHDLFVLIALLTLVFVGGQILFVYLHLLTSNLINAIVSSSLGFSILRSPVVMKPIILFLMTQAVLYGLFIYLICFITQKIRVLFSLTNKATKILGLALWFVSIIFIFSANSVYVIHSYFTDLMINHLFNSSLSTQNLQMILTASVAVIGFALSLAFMQLTKEWLQNKSITVPIIIFCGIIILIVGKLTETPTNQIAESAATAEKPNIILIGLDALRPDFIGEHPLYSANTPNLNAFLQESIQFDETYTPLARTFPTWTTILTGKYPLHHLARGNNADHQILKIQETLATRLKQTGYETYYATDDRRFNTTNEQFGFDHVIGPSTGLNDFLIGNLNDFPLSNLLINTWLGHWLFPYNYANHGAFITYEPHKFLNLIHSTLQEHTTKPLFLAVHFNLTAWPFHWMHDPQNINANELNRYRNSIAASDQQFGVFIQQLQQQHLLDHAIVIFLSDHGITLGLQHDRSIRNALYQGDRDLIYKIGVHKLEGTATNKTDFDKNYSSETSYGYGGDILSLKQNHAVMAFKTFGVTMSAPHHVTGLASLMDITPTLLDWLNLSPLQQSDGLSLKSYLLNPQLMLPTNRIFFMETSYSIPEIEKENISIAKVLSKSINLFRLDPVSGMIFFKPSAEKIMDTEKEFSVMQGKWLLAYLPSTTITKLGILHNQIVPLYYPMPAFYVLINTKTGAWTMNWDTPLAKRAPLDLLRTKLIAFYGIKSIT